MPLNAAAPMKALHSNGLPPSSRLLNLKSITSSMSKSVMASPFMLSAAKV